MSGLNTGKLIHIDPNSFQSYKSMFKTMSTLKCHNVLVVLSSFLKNTICVAQYVHFEVQDTCLVHFEVHHTCLVHFEVQHTCLVHFGSLCCQVLR